MNEAQIELRQQRGREIAARLRIVQQEDGSWKVPSSKSGRKSYEVNVHPTNVSCTCPDHEETGQRCKHIYAVEFLIQGEQDKAKETGGQVEPIRARKPTYGQKNWSGYNGSQTREEEEFLRCSTISARRSPNPSATSGAVARSQCGMPAFAAGYKGVSDQIGAASAPRDECRLRARFPRTTARIQYDPAGAGNAGKHGHPARLDRQEQPADGVRGNDLRRGLDGLRREPLCPLV